MENKQPESKCEHRHSSVVTSRFKLFFGKETKRRLRECTNCGYRWVTREIKEEWIKKKLRDTFCNDKKL